MKVKFYEYAKELPANEARFLELVARLRWMSERDNVNWVWLHNYVFTEYKNELDSLDIDYRWNGHDISHEKEVFLIEVRENNCNWDDCNAPYEEGVREYLYNIQEKSDDLCMTLDVVVGTWATT